MKPLVELHLHLDGSLRIPTMLEIARAENIILPATDEAGLRAALACGEIRADLPQYLKHFDYTTSVMQSRLGLTRIATELMEDCAAEGLRYVEVRYMPWLSTRGGLVEEDVIEAILDGLRIGGLRAGIGWGFIVCSLRNVDPAITQRQYAAAARYRKNGVVAVDLAGDDKLDLRPHAAAFRHAMETGLEGVAHAGESSSGQDVLDAMCILGARRIGHGTQALRDKRLRDEIWMRGVGIEACLTSNLQTRTAASYAEHSALDYVNHGGLICLNTDNRMLADTTMTHELGLASIHWKLQLVQVQRLIWNAIEMAFISKDAKTALHAELRAEAHAAIAASSP